MFVSSNPTPFDLNFSLFGTRVRVHAFFWLFTAILGWDLIRHDDGLTRMGIWLVCVFASILLHEFGHIWAGRAFGSDGEILLYSFGGLAIGASDLRGRGRRIAVYLAGPGIQLLLYALLWVVIYRWGDGIRAWPRYLKVAWSFLLQINLLWALFNLLPVWPLDGGQTSREVCEGVWGRNGTRYSLVLSIATAAFLAINTLLYVNGGPYVPYIHGGGTYTVILFALLGVESYFMLQQLNREPWADERGPWER
jgi:stage IV sporulation protein FB